MTISATTNRAVFNGNSSTTVFTFLYPVFETSSLVAYVLAADGSVTTPSCTKVLLSGGYSGCTVTFAVAPTTGTKVVLVRIPTFLQAQDLIDNARVPAATTVKVYDRLTTYALRDLDMASRSIRLHDAVAASFDTVLPTVLTPLGVVAVKEDGTGIDLIDPVDALFGGSMEESTILGRRSGADGAAEAISLGTGLYMTGTTLEAVVGRPDANSVNTAAIQDDAVTLAKLADLAAAKIVGRRSASSGDPEAISPDASTLEISSTTLQVKSGGITATQLASDAVTTAKVQDVAVTAAKLASDSVTTAKILDANVTTAKIASNAVTYAKIQAVSGAAKLLGSSSSGGGSSPSEISLGTGLSMSGSTLSASVGTPADGSVSTAKLADDAVTFAKFQNIATGSLLGRVTAGSGDPEEVYPDTSLDFGGGTLGVAAGGVSSTELASNAVTTAKILDANVTTAKIADSAVTAAKIAPGNVTLTKIENVTASRLLGRGSAAGAGAPLEITLGTGLSMSGTTLSSSGGTPDDNSVSTAKIQDDAVTTAKIAANAVTTAKILTNNVTLSKLEQSTAAGVIVGRRASSAGNFEELTADGSTLEVSSTNLRIKPGGVGTTQLADNAVQTAKIIDDAVTTSKIATSAVTLARMANVSASTVLGRTDASSGAPQALTLGTGIAISGTTLYVTGGTPDDNSVSTAKIVDGAVTLAKMSNLSQNTFIGRYTASTGVPQAVAISGKFTLSGGTLDLTSGSVALANLASDSVSTVKIVDGNVTLAKIANAAASSKLLGSGATGSGSPYSEITLGTGLSMSGTTISASVGTVADDSVSTAKIQDDAVTFAKIQNLTTDRLLGRDTAGTGDPEEISVTSPLAFSGSSALTTSISTGRLVGRTTASSGPMEQITPSAQFDLSSGGLALAASAVTATELASNAVTTAKILDANVTLAKIANAAASSKLVGSGASGSGAAYAEITLGTNLSMAGTTLNATGSGGTPDDNSVSTAKIQDDAVTFAKIQNVNANRILGRGAGSGAGDVQEILFSSAYFSFSTTNVVIASGSIDYDALATDAVITAKIANDAVTFAKMQNITSARLLGRTTASAGDIEQLTVDSTMTLASGNLGVASGGIGATQLASDAVTQAKIADDAVGLPELKAGTANKLIGFDASGDPAEISAGSGVTISSGTISASASAPAYSDITSIPTDRLVGRDTAGTGVGEAISLDSTMAWSGSGSIGVASGGIAATQLASDAVTTVKILDANVTKAKFENVTSGKLLGRTSASTGAPQEISPDASTIEISTTTLQVKTGGVTATQLASDAVTTAKILDANVTLAKIANISTARLLGRTTASAGVIEQLTVDSTLSLASTNLGVASGGITATQLASDAVTTAKILDNNVTLAKLAAASAANKILGRRAGSGGNYEELAPDGSTIELSTATLQVKAGGITATQLASDAVTQAKIADDAVGLAELHAGTANKLIGFDASGDPAEISAGTNVTISSGTISASLTSLAYTAINSVPTPRLLGRTSASTGAAEALTVDSTLALASGNLGVASGGITVTQLADDSVETAKIKNLNVTTGKLAANAVTFAKFVAASAGSKLVGSSSSGAGDFQEISPDGSTIQVSTTTLQVVSGGITATQLGPAAVTEAKLHDDVLLRLAETAMDDSVSPPTASAARGFVDGTGNEGLVTELGTPGSAVRVQTAGTAYSHRGKRVVFSTSASIGSFSAPGVGNDRKDIVVLKEDATFAVRTGSAASTGTAVDPTLSAGDIPLARVFLQGTDATVNTADITDLRERNVIDGGKLLSNTVTLAKLAQAASAARVLGRRSGSTGNYEEIAPDASTIEISSTTLQVKSGGITATQLASDAVTSVKILADAVTTAKILDANVTLAKIANIATSRVLGRTTAASGVIEELTVTGPLSLASGALTTSMATSRLIGRTTASTGVMEEISVTGPLSLASGALTTSIATSRLVGRTTASTGVMEELTVTSPLSLSSGTLTTSISTSRILGRTTASSGAVEQLTVTAPIALSSGTVTTSMSTGKLIGRTTASTGVMEEISVTGPLSLASGALTTSMSTGKLIGRTTALTGVMEEITVGDGLSLASATLKGKLMQVVYSQDGAVATGTTTIPFDDSIPQNTEGTQFLSLAITPKSASSTLYIEVDVHGTHSVSSVTVIGALFQDATANALAAGIGESYKNGSPAVGNGVAFNHSMASPGTSTYTFKVRVGSDTAGTYTFNGEASGRKLGGVMASSIKITEVL